MTSIQSKLSHGWRLLSFRNASNTLDSIYVCICYQEMSQLMRLWYLSHRRPAKAQASLRIRSVLPEPSLFAWSMEVDEGFDQKADI